MLFYRNITFLVLFFSCSKAIPLAKLYGDLIENESLGHLSVEITGNVGVNPDAPHVDESYWVSAAQTSTSATVSDILLEFAFTGQNLADDDSIDLTTLSFDLGRHSLMNSNPVLQVYLDTGDGYGDSIYTSTEVSGITPHRIILRETLTGESYVKVGFAFSDVHGLSSRTHYVDNLVLNGSFDLDSGVAGLDINNNGVSDVWEHRYRANELVDGEEVKNEDFDGDGVSNFRESLFGTDPRNANDVSQFKVNRRISTTTGKDEVSVDFDSVEGKKYVVYGTGDLTSELWTEDSVILGDGEDFSVAVQPIENVDRYFFKVNVEDIDEDNDGLTAAEESFVQGFSDNSDSSDEYNGQTDYQRLKEIFQSQEESELSISLNGGSMLYEAQGNQVELILTRTSPLGDAHLNLSESESYVITDTTRVASNAASVTDYLILDADGVELANDIVTIPVGAASVSIFLQAVSDGLIESDEQITISIGDDVQVNLWVSDSQQVSSEDYIAIAQAGHFLSQASLGGTPETISQLANEIQSMGYLEACENWIDQQLLIERETTVTDDCLEHQAVYLNGATVPTINIQNFEIVWWRKAIETNEQLRHRMALSLSQVFVTSAAFWANEERGNVWTSYTKYYDKLMDLAFSNHRELLQVISYDPFMGVYLSCAQNKLADEELGTFPDENYAREVMQLFSCGVYAQNQFGGYILDENNERIENYSNADITELAEVFTGLGLTDIDGELVNFDNPVINSGTRYFHPMLMVQEYHDESTKILLDGTVLPAGQTGDEDISDALDVLAAHPSTAPHLSRLLIKRFTSSNPSFAYIGRVVEAWNGGGEYGSGESGSFVSIIKAILLDPEARYNVNYQVDLDTDEVNALIVNPILGRMKEPMLKETQLYRFTQCISADDELPILFKPLTKAAANDQTPDFGQIPMRAPSVFNFYDSEHSPSLGVLADAEGTYNQDLTAPEAEILTPHIIQDFETYYSHINQDDPQVAYAYSGITHTVLYSYLEYLYSKCSTVEEFVSDINLWFCHGQLSPTMRSNIATLANENGGATRENFAKIFSLIFNSPDFSVSH